MSAPEPPPEPSGVAGREKDLQGIAAPTSQETGDLNRPTSGTKDDCAWNTDDDKVEASTDP